MNKCERNETRKNYNDSIKNNWRKWQWNRICERLKKPERDAFVLYLAGLNDLDRKIAISKGFKNINLIAVDKDEEIIENIRKVGGFGICEDIFKLLIAWEEPKIDVLVLDFCQGWCKETLKYIIPIIISKGISDGAIVSINLYRARDKKFTEYRESFKQYNLTENYHNIGGKHRAKHWHNFLTETMTHYILNTWYYFNNQKEQFNTRSIFQRNKNIKEEVYLSYLKAIWRESIPCFNQYRAINQITFMDSVVFKINEYVGKDIWEDMRHCILPKNEWPKMKIAGLKAVRTRKGYQSCGQFISPI